MKLSTACCRLALFLSLWCLAFYQGLLSYEWFETGVMTLGEEEDWRRQPLKKPNILFILADDLGLPKLEAELLYYCARFVMTQAMMMFRGTTPTSLHQP